MLVDADSLRRLVDLDGSSVWISIVRARQPSGGAIVREGILRLKEAPASSRVDAMPERILAEVVDGDDVRLAIILSTEILHRWNNIVRAERRLTFRVEVSDQEFAGTHGGDPPCTYLKFARDLAAELEAGFREGVTFEPDPDPTASWEALYEEFFPQPAALTDGASLNIAANSRSVIVRQNERGNIEVTFFAPVMRNGQLICGIFRRKKSDTVPCSSAGVQQLGWELRRFFYGWLDQVLEVDQ